MSSFALFATPTGDIRGTGTFDMLLSVSAAPGHVIDGANPVYIRLLAVDLAAYPSGIRGASLSWDGSWMKLSAGGAVDTLTLPYHGDRDWIVQAYQQEAGENGPVQQAQANAQNNAAAPGAVDIDISELRVRTWELGDA